MIKEATKFFLTEAGRLPKKTNLVCHPYGIYVFIVDNEIIRFGESGSGFKRISKGFNHQLYRTNGKKNYIAYHFREKYCQKEIEVRFYISKENILTTPEARRAIEAELAFQYRLKKNKWPSAMVEIHFFNDLNKKQIAFVNKILIDLKLKQT